MKDWVTMKEAAYLVNRDVSRISRWRTDGRLRSRRNERGHLEVASEDVLKAEATAVPGRKPKPRDTPSEIAVQNPAQTA